MRRADHAWIPRYLRARGSEIDQRSRSRIAAEAVSQRDAFQGVPHDLQSGCVRRFDSLEDIRVGARVFAAMDASETPGTRVSVDMCELKLERTA